MNGSARQYGIVAAVDGSPDSDGAVRWAAAEAAARNTCLTLIHVVPTAPVEFSAPEVVLEIDRWQMSSGEQVLVDARSVAEAATEKGVRPTEVKTVLERRSAVAALTRASNDALMVVVGGRGRGPIGRRLLGSVSAALIRHASCPVVVTHGSTSTDPTAAHRPVLLGLDGTSASELATGEAFDVASRRGVGLIALHAWSDVGVFPLLGMDWRNYEDDGETVLTERLAQWGARYPDVKVERRLVCDRPTHWLLEEAKSAQLVVVGSHGRGGFAGMLLGSVSTAVAEEAPVPVMVVRS